MGKAVEVTRLVVDTRSYDMAALTAYVAAAYRVGLVLLVQDVVRGDKLRQMVARLFEACAYDAQPETVSVPSGSEDVAEVVESLAEADDILLSDSCLVAQVFLLRGALAFDSYGSQFLDESIERRVSSYRYKAFKAKMGAPCWGYQRRHTKKTDGRLLVALGDALSRRGLQRAMIPAIDSWNPPTVYVDADSCPNTAAIVSLAERQRFRVVLVADTVHSMVNHYNRKPQPLFDILPGFSVEDWKVPVGKDSADRAILNAVQAGDVVVTDDSRLAEGALKRSAWTIDSWADAHEPCDTPNLRTPLHRERRRAPRATTQQVTKNLEALVGSLARG